MKKLKEAGNALIYISHKMDEIYRLADRITVLRDGHCVGTAPVSELPRDALVRWMVGRELGERFPAKRHETPSQGVPALTVRGLSGPKLHDVSLDVRAGEILGIGGLQGAGGSELLASLFGAYGPLEQGWVEVEGKLVRIRSPRDAIRVGLAFLTNDRKATGLVLGLGIRENVSLASLKKHSRGPWVRRVSETDRAHAQRVRLGIRARSIEQEVGTLSGGNQQKVALAKWLETAPKVLLLDEPTRGVDIGAKQEIYELIRELTAHGTAVVLISTEMPELLALSDRVVVMHRGSLSAELSREHATQESVLEAAMGVGPHVIPRKPPARQEVRTS
jgi:ABC-type sugar transport system ATPase subunit